MSWYEARAWWCRCLYHCYQGLVRVGLARLMGYVWGEVKCPPYRWVQDLALAASAELARKCCWRDGETGSRYYWLLDRVLQDLWLARLVESSSRYGYGSATD